jgi:3-oxoacyl-[acyl-carrier-protein] synthase III
MECLVCLLITHSGTSAIAVLANLGLTEYVCQAYHLSTKCEHVLVALMTLDDLTKADRYDRQHLCSTSRENNSGMFSVFYVNSDLCLCPCEYVS